MDVLVPVLMLGAACAGSFLLQRWIARAHPDLPDPRPCGGCCGDRLCEIQRSDQWHAPPCERRATSTSRDG